MYENVYTRTRDDGFTERVYVPHNGYVAQVDLELLERMLFDLGYRYERRIKA